MKGKFIAQFTNQARLSYLDNVTVSNVAVGEILEAITVTATFNGTALTEGKGYSYNEATGLFSTLDGQITVPSATYTQGADGTYTVIPGVSTLIITGTI